LPFGLDAFEFELTPTLRVVHAPPDYGWPGRFNAQIIQGTDACAALVIRSVAGCSEARLAACGWWCRRAHRRFVECPLRIAKSGRSITAHSANCIGQRSSSPIFGLPNKFALFRNIRPPLAPKRAQFGAAVELRNQVVRSCLPSCSTARWAILAQRGETLPNQILRRLSRSP